MSNDKIPAVKCERCEENIPESADVRSLGDFDILCDCCAEDFRQCFGPQCEELGTDFVESRNGDFYCDSCQDNLVECDDCGQLTDTYNYSIYEHDGYSYCDDCATGNCAYECHSCGCEVSVYTSVNCEGYDFVCEEMCEDCYERRSRISHIDSAVDTSIDKSVLDGAYIKPNSWTRRELSEVSEGNGLTEAQSREYQSFSKFFNRFYAYFGDGYESQKMIIKKGAFGYDRWGWFETSVQIESELNEKVFTMLDYFITDNSSSMYRPHGKFGRYQPFAFAFAKLCQFYISSDNWGDAETPSEIEEKRYIKGRYPSLELIDYKKLLADKLADAPNKEARDNIYGSFDIENGVWLRFYVDFIDRAKLRQCIKDRKMPDGKCLIKTVNKLITQHVKSANQFHDLYGDSDDEESVKAFTSTAHPLAPSEFEKLESAYRIKSCWHHYNYESFWNKYCTNSINVTIPARIGFDAQAHEKVVAFNDRVGACQGSSYKETLGFNHISMSSNPHLYLIFYDPEDETSIIGRSAIRLLWKRSSSKNGFSEPEKDTLYIAPSRLYLDGYSHGKNQFYSGMYKALDEWKDVIAERLGAKEVKMIAYHRTRHDSYSMRDYVSNANDKKIAISFEETDPNYNESKAGKFVTDWFYPIWLEKPQEEAYWGYYPDEYQGYESAYVDSSVYSSYATRETYNGHYSLIEVKNE